LPGALPSLASAQPPPLHVWAALRCGAEGCGGASQLVRACAWEHFGDTRLAGLAASLQLRFHKPASLSGRAVAALPPPAPPSAVLAAGAPADGAPAPQRPLIVGIDLSRPTQTDRVLAACKLAVLAFGPKGEEGALQMLVQLRPHCAAPPLFALWRQHTLEVLVRGAVLRGEQRRASEFLALQKKEVAAQHGASDVTWAAELELLIQQGENFQAICKAADLEKTRPLGKAGGLACPRATIKLAMAKAHALGGDPLNAMPHALTAIALAEQASLQSVYASAALQLAEVQLELDPPRALALLHKVRPQVMRNGSTYQAAQLQALTAHCRLAQLPDFNATTPPQLQPLRTHILPAIRDALNGFVKLRCHNEAAQLLYLRARIWNSLTDVEADALDQRDRDAELFCRAEEEAKRAAMRPSGAVFEYAEPGVLEAHLQRLKELDAEAATLYASAST